MIAHTINANRLTHSIELRVTGLRSLKFRIRLAALIFRFGGWVAGMPINIEAEKVEGTK